MQKTVTYLYPIAEKASSLKMYQDRTNQIKAFYFTKDNIKEVSKLPSSENYAVYFLFNNSEIDERRIYIGQSMNGINRINEHVKGKEFWSYCIMFVTDNNSFDKLTIDYLEYEFINRFKKSSFILSNKDMRNVEPILSIYDRPKLESFIEHITFMLNAEGVTIEEIKVDDTSSDFKYYYPSKTYKAKLFVRDGKFVLSEGSVLKRPPESAKEWKDDRHYYRLNSIIDEYIDDGKVIVVNNENITTVNIVFDAPSLPADLVTGHSENGWRFFKGLNELREECESKVEL